MTRFEASIRTTDGTRAEVAESHDYFAAKADLEGRVGEGEQLLSLRRLDD